MSSFLADNNIKKGVYSAITFSSYEQNDKPKGWGVQNRFIVNHLHIEASLQAKMEGKKEAPADKLNHNLTVLYN